MNRIKNILQFSQNKMERLNLTNKQSFIFIFTRLNKKINYLALQSALQKIRFYKKKTNKIGLILCKIHQRKLIQSFISIKASNNHKNIKFTHSKQIYLNFSCSIIIKMLKKIQIRNKGLSFNKIVNFSSQVLKYNQVKKQALNKMFMIGKEIVLRQHGVFFLIKLKDNLDRIKYKKYFFHKLNKLSKNFKHRIQKDVFESILLFGYKKIINKQIQQKQQKGKIKKQAQLGNLEQIRKTKSQLAILKKELQNEQRSVNITKKDQHQRDTIIGIKLQQNLKLEIQLQKNKVENNVLKFQYSKRKQQSQRHQVAKSNSVVQNYQEKVQKVYRMLSNYILNQNQKSEADNKTVMNSSIKKSNSTNQNTSSSIIQMDSANNSINSRNPISDTIEYKQLSIICQRNTIDLNNSIKQFIITKQYQTDQNIQLKTLVNIFQDHYSTNSNVSASSGYKNTFQQNLNLRQLVSNIIVMMINQTNNQSYKISNKDKINKIIKSHS